MQELINAKIEELTKNGKLDEIVTAQATKFIQGIVNDTLSSYGDVQKAYKEKIQKNILDNLERLDFIQYSKSISDLIEAELNKSVVEIGIVPIKKMIQDFTGSLEKKEWKLSEIINKFKEEEVIPEEHNESGEIGFVHEESDYGTVYIGFDEDEKSNRRHSCKYRLMVDKKTKRLYTPHVDGILLHPIKEMGGLYGFDLFLFKLYAMQCTIELDFDNVETEWSTFN